MKKVADDASGSQQSLLPEVIVHVAAEGGGIKLIGCRLPDGWLFSRAVTDWTPELLGEEWIHHESDMVRSWEAALEILDEYQWFRLTPRVVHKDFRERVLDAVVARYGERAETSNSTFWRWEKMCRGPTQ